MIGTSDDIIPSWLKREDQKPEVDLKDFFMDDILHFGEVQRVVYPEDPASRTGKFIEYDVYIQYQGNGTGAGRMYSGCVLFNLFAGLADKIFWSLRASNSASDTNKKALGLGSKVAILCLNGITTNPLIIGGLRDQQEDPKQEIEWSKNGKDKKPGRYFFFEFNGIKIYINDDGELSFSYNGRTTDDGKKDADVADTDVGTSLNLQKDGSANIKTKDDEQNITLNHKDKKISFKYKNKLEIGQATDSLMLGTTYRNAEKAMHTKILTTLNSLNSTLKTLGTQLNAAGTAAAGGPAAALAPGLNAAGGAAIAASEQISQVASEINTFEQKANQFLSPNVSTD